MNHLLREVLPALGLDEEYAAAHLDLPAGSALPAALPVNTLACGSVAAAGLAGAALRGGERVKVDPRQVAVSFRNDQLQTIGGRREPGFAPLSGFFEADDGWVRTHANYPHHRTRLLRALGLPDAATRDDVTAAIAGGSAQEVEDVVTTDHGIAVRVRTVREWMASEPARAVAGHDLLSVTSVGSGGASRPSVTDRGCST